MADSRDQEGRKPGAQPVCTQQVQNIVPGQALQHAQQHALGVKMTDGAACSDRHLVEIVRIDIVVPDDVSHDGADRFLVLCRDHGLPRLTLYVNRCDRVYGAAVRAEYAEFDTPS